MIFPEKFDGLYARLDRPHSEIAPWSIWISYSPDLRYWGESQLIMRPVQYHWDEMKIGPGAPPIKTNQGWLSIYHGVFQTMDGSVYRLGVALHDLRNPANVIGVGDSWILQPEDPWEITGYVHNVVFTCGAVAEPDGTVKIYWGGADTVMCVGEANLTDLVALCLEPRQTAKIGETSLMGRILVAEESGFEYCRPFAYFVEHRYAAIPTAPVFGWRTVARTIEPTLIAQKHLAFEGRRIDGSRGAKADARKCQ